LKVAIFLTDTISPQDGGGFSYTERLIRGIDSFEFHSSIEVCFTGRFSSSDVSLKRKYLKLSSSRVYKFFHILEKIKFFKFLRLAFKTDFNFQNKSDKNILKKNKVHLVLYLKQGYKEIYDFPFISMNWDIAHKSSYSFPEFTSDPTFDHRQKWYNEELQRAFAIIAESRSGRKEILQYCAVSPEKIYVVPLFPGKVTEMNVDEASQNSVLQNFKLSRKKYFYYPAQFWAHKNHYNLLLAFKEIKSDAATKEIRLVFSGSDQGNKAYVKSLIEELGLSSDVVTLGFISNEDVYTLYNNAIALVMPTFLGPTNMPLLEAQVLGVPVICSDFEGHREICKDSALYVNPQNSQSIAEAMRNILNTDIYYALLERSKQISKESQFTVGHALKALDETLRHLEPARKTFP
jgi:glycosyltransferase involved in cell wall biosynthesis